MTEDIENYILDSSDEIYNVETNNALEDYNETIINLMAIRCHHQCKYHTNTDHQVNHCTAIVNKIEEAVDNCNYTFSDECMDTFIEYINYQHDYWYTLFGCIKENHQLFVKVFSKLYINYIPTKEQIKTLLTCPEYDECLKVLVDKNKKFTKFDAQTLSDFARIRMKHSEDKTDEKMIIDTILQNCNLPDDCIDDDTISARNTYYSNVLANMLYKYGGTFTQDHMHIACEFLPYTINLINVLLIIGLELDKKSLEIACQYADEESLKYVVGLAKIPINDAKYNMCYSKEHCWVEYRLKVIQDKYNQINRVDSGGYRNASNDIIIKKIKVFTDNEYMKDNKNKCKYMTSLYNYCRIGHSNGAKQLIQNYKLVPDYKCFEYLYKKRYVDIAFITYLLLVIDKYEVTLVAKIAKETVEACKKDKVAQNKIDKVQIIDINSSNKSNNDTKIVDKFILKEYNDNFKSTKKYSFLMEKEIFSNESMNIDNILKNLDDGCFNVKFNDSIVKIKVPEDKRIIQQAPKKYITYFKKSDNICMSYLEIRKEFIDNIRTKKWFKKDNKQLVNLPKSLRNKLGLDKDGYIQFGDIDKIIDLFYDQ